MIKHSKKNFEISLQERIKLAGARVITSPHPRFEFKEGQLILCDQWTIQLIHTTQPNSAEPRLLEFPVTWEETFPWSQAPPVNISVEYKKKPKITFVQSQLVNQTQPVIYLTIETPIKINFSDEKPVFADKKPNTTANDPPLGTLPPTFPQNAEPSQANRLTYPEKLMEIESKFNKLTEEHRKLSQLVEELSQHLAVLEEKLTQQQTKAKLFGYIVDSFRLTPVNKAIVEIARQDSEEPLYKLTSNHQGFFFSEDMEPGIYNIRVKHPRYHPLIMRDYCLTGGEVKNQDFLLKRI